MNLKIMKLAAILLVTFITLSWLRANDVFDFDIRMIVPFMRGGVTIHDWAGLALIALGWWGLTRLRRQTNDGRRNEDVEEPDQSPTDWRDDFSQHAEEADE